MGLLRRYRATGADLPFGDPLRAHDVAMEGYFLRVTDRERGRVVIALIGVNRGPDGHWATLGLASDEAPIPIEAGGSRRDVDGNSSSSSFSSSQGSSGSSTLRLMAAPDGWADPDRIGARSGELFEYRPDGVRVDMGEGARLHVNITDPVQWPHHAVGGSSIFQSVPALNQYWHPWLLGGRALGYAVVAGERVDLTGGQVYAEKNWGREGFPESWWWGQAHGFAERSACVAFAGGQVSAGPLRTEVTAVVVRLPGGRVLRWGNPLVSPVTAHVSDDTWRLHGRLLRPDGLWRVEVRGSAPLRDAHVLPVPLPSQHRNIAGALEHLGGRMDVTVTRQSGRRGAQIVWEGRSEVAGLEHGSLALAARAVRDRGWPDGATHAPPAAPGTP